MQRAREYKEYMQCQLCGKTILKKAVNHKYCIKCSNIENRRLAKKRALRIKNEN